MKISKKKVKAVMDDVSKLDLPDGHHWALIHERLGLKYGDVFDFIEEDPSFFGAILRYPQESASE